MLQMNSFCLQFIYGIGILNQVFHKRMPPEAIDLTSRLLQYSPSLRCTAVSFSLFVHPCCDVFTVLVLCVSVISIHVEL